MISYTTRLFLHSLIWFSMLICLSSGLPTNQSVFPSEGEQEYEMFLQWTKEHGRKYPNSEETETRYNTFKSNLKYITDTNAKRSKSPSGYRLGLNKFADMSPEEFSEVYLRKLEMPTTIDTAAATTTIAPSSMDSCGAPASMDWRKKGVLTPVKNQEKCGSCWAFAATGAMESIYAKSTGQLISLSEQELVDCDTFSHGCKGGWSHYAFQWVINNGGISEEAAYPYVAQQGYCRANMKNGGKVMKISSYTHVEQSDDALLCATAQQPITAALNAIDLQFYHEGIYDGENCPKDSTQVTHIALIVGYDSKDGKDYWIVKNSWGEDWGMNGYFFIQRNTNLPYGVCSLNAWAYFPNI